MHKAEDDGFRAFAITQAPALRRSAFLFTGDWHLAEDLMQTTLIKMYRSWSKVQRQESLTNYARTVLLRTWLDEKRRPWRRSERTAAEPPDVADPAVDLEAALSRDWDRGRVAEALLDLPPRQRAVLVLRYFDDLSVAETAAVLRCAEGTVKSQAARGLVSLRAILARLAGTDIAREVTS